MKIELDVEIPEGYEATGEFRAPVLGEWVVSLQPPLIGIPTARQFDNSHVPTCRYIILRRKEPDAVQLAKAVRVLVQSMTTPQIGGLANSLANKIVADFERESK
jgi:hypothetical protein